MNVKVKHIFNFFIAGLFISFNLMASDFAKEKRWADQIVDDLMVGEAQWLSAEGKKFLGIYTKNTTDKVSGGVIVLHGLGIHPNWVDVVQPLRSDLPDEGWQTIALQMPVLRNEAEYKEYVPLFSGVPPRVKAAISFLKSKGVKNIIIVGHSLGSTMGAYFMSLNKDPSVKAFVAVGVSGAINEVPWYLNSLAKIKVPVLDIYGSDDLPQVLTATEKKAAVARAAGNKNYDQIMVEGADHFFKGKSDELVKQVASWIKRFAEK
ncbi:MAG: DUF3530 family protein [Gammaproteobacteria bacterium]|nr:DUF3530 family protein [Gammaproteobacteria bacterium]